MKYGIFGGTFDPVHIGHLRVAVEAKEHLGLDAVFFVPASIAPHKMEKSVAASAVHRLAMLKLAIEPWSFMKVLDYEIGKGGVGYTVDTVAYIRNRFGEKNAYYLLIGSDWAEAVRHWKSYDKIKRMARIAVFPRHRGDKPPSNGLLLPCPVLAIRSTDIRSHSVSPGSPDPVPPRVREYIRARNLYGKKAGGRS